MNLDLHVHTNYSDGCFSPSQILKMAKDLNLQILSITDHDTTEGVKKLLKLDFGAIKVIPGIEIEANIINKKKIVHILGYGIKIELDNKELNKIQNSRLERNHKLFQNLKNLGLNVDLEEFINTSSLSGDNPMQSVGRPHFAKYLIKKSYASDFNDAFNKYLSEQSGKAYVSRDVFDAKRSIKFIQQNGGKAFLAHPNTINIPNNEMDELVKKLKEFNLDGIEIYNGSIKNFSYSQFLKSLTLKNELLFSAGSDFHGYFKKNVFLGQIYQSNKIKKFSSNDISQWFIENKF